ncbi:hypothetical protein [Paenibacillus sp. DMB20]|uniref:hypothetical protein n=1 Tax=Paenibacillus sp. DMB20 TaxID=1642570 RepID=UPI00128D46AF|nr:hypothetical protein [Paenibacillus sp. DMB20]
MGKSIRRRSRRRITGRYVSRYPGTGSVITAAVQNSTMMILLADKCLDAEWDVFCTADAFTR